VASGVVGTNTAVCGDETSRCIVFPPTNFTAFTWAALLTEGGAEQLELVKA
jgi:hypothetical protein